VKNRPALGGRAGRDAGFTLIELLVVLGVVAAIALLAAPTFVDMVVMQRLRGVNAQLVTDLQFARSEAVARGRIVRLNFGVATNGSQSCYVIYTSTTSSTRCNCLSTPVCPAGTVARELRTVSVPASTRVALNWPDTQDSAFGYDPVTGGLLAIPQDQPTAPLPQVQIDTRVDDERRLRTFVAQTGRPTVCAPGSSGLGVAAC
jgi:type IV fimbrial biogenesis protein FimT